MSSSPQRLQEPELFKGQILLPWWPLAGVVALGTEQLRARPCGVRCGLPCRKHSCAHSPLGVNEAARQIPVCAHIRAVVLSVS